MQFCEKCGVILLPQKDEGRTLLKCGKCGVVNTKREHLIIKDTSVHTNRSKIEVVEKRIDTLPKIKEDCTECGHKEAFYWTVQTRSADEAETRFFKCVKCNHTWRAYS